MYKILFLAFDIAVLSQTLAAISIVILIAGIIKKNGRIMLVSKIS